MHRRLFLGLLAIFLAGHVACVDKLDANGGDTALYLHSVEGGTTAKIQVFNDLDTLFTKSTASAPAKTLTSELLSQAQALPLAWGGLALDAVGNRLYVVSEKGTIVRIERLRNQLSGAIPTNEAVSFTLASADRLPGTSTFGQAAFDSNTLYVTEANSDGTTQIWSISSPEAINSGFAVPLKQIALTPGDRFGSGLAAGDGSFYGYFNEGDRLDELLNVWRGARLRRGTGSSFPLTGSVIGGDKSLMGRYGSLAFDSGNKLLYFARHNAAGVITGKPILVFTNPLFGGVANVAPTAMGNESTMSNLRVIAHGGSKDWLAALTDNADSTFFLWKDPGKGDTSVTRSLDSGSIRGLAFDGKN